MNRVNLYIPEVRIINGRRCNCDCEKALTNPQGMAGLIIGRRLNDARLIYSNIRAVIVDGQAQIVTQDYRPERINVETNNNYITRIIGFY